VDIISKLGQLVRNNFTNWRSLGDVAVKPSPDGKLLLFNYTAKAQYAGRWNEFERVCRGLILDAETGAVVARPFDKFFNWGEGGRTTDAALIEATEKLDGSLGIGYRHGGEWRVATRGSFTSDQALWATDFLRRNPDMARWPHYLTPLFEIIYPGNRIVVDYGGKEFLVLIGARNKLTGRDLFFREFGPLGTALGFLVPTIYHIYRPEDALRLAGELSGNEEGFVLRFADGQRFKVKGAEYLRLHKIMCGLSPKMIFEMWRDGKIADLAVDVPDEMLVSVREWTVSFDEEYGRILNEAQSAFNKAPKDSRKEFALWAKENAPSVLHYLFMMLDGRDVEKAVRADVYRAVKDRLDAKNAA